MEIDGLVKMTPAGYRHEDLFRRSGGSGQLPQAVSRAKTRSQEAIARYFTCEAPNAIEGPIGKTAVIF